MMESSKQFLTFSVDGATCAMPVVGIREIVEYSEITPVPTLPPEVRGVINLRGLVVPVVDLGLRCGRRRSAVTRLTCIVIVEVELDGELTIAGLLVDAVRHVVDELAIEQPPQFGTAIPAGLLAGVAPVEDGLACVLDLPRVLALEALGAG